MATATIPSQSIRVISEPPSARAKSSIGGFAAELYRTIGDGSGKMLSFHAPHLEQYHIGHGATEREKSLSDALNSTGGPIGGFLLPPNHARSVWDKLCGDPSNLLARTDRIEVEGDYIDLPAATETSRVTGSRWGGLRAYRVPEGAINTPSHPEVRMLRLEPKPLTIQTRVSRKLAQSAAGLNEFLSRAVPAEFAFAIGREIVAGTGLSDQCRGIIDAPGTVRIAKESGQAAATINALNIAKMLKAFHPQSRLRGVWLANPGVEAALPELLASSGAASPLVTYQPLGSVQGSPYAHLGGYPVIPCEVCPSLGTVGDLILADLSCYALGYRGMQETPSIHVRFDYAEESFRWVFEVGGQPWLSSPVTLADGATQVSSFVTLATRA